MTADETCGEGGQRQGWCLAGAVGQSRVRVDATEDPYLCVFAGSVVMSVRACLVASKTFENSCRQETTSLFNLVFKYLTWKALMCICNPCKLSTELAFGDTGQSSIARKQACGGPAGARSVRKLSSYGRLSKGGRRAVLGTLGSRHVSVYMGVSHMSSATLGSLFLRI